MEEITYRTGTYYGEAETLHVWEITDEAGTAAELYVSLDTHEVMNIEVREDRRGEGLARALWDTANTRFEIFHAPAGHRTEEGDTFARAVGGSTVTTCAMGGCYACTEAA